MTTPYNKEIRNKKLDVVLKVHQIVKSDFVGIIGGEGVKKSLVAKCRIDIRPKVKEIASVLENIKLPTCLYS